MNHKEQMDYREKTNELMEEATLEFYEWEKTVDMILSDDDRIVWMQGYIWATIKSKEKTMQEITTEQIRQWIGQDSTIWLDLLYEIVNGKYTVEEMRKDILDSDLGE